MKPFPVKILVVTVARLWPFYTLAHNNLAAVLGDSAEAERHLKIALSIDPGHTSSCYNIALLLRYVPYKSFITS